MKVLTVLVLLFSAQFFAIAANKNMLIIGNTNVHYIALNSTFLTPEIASTYNIIRSKYNAFINISVLDNTLTHTPAKSVNLVRSATNLLGQKKSLIFTEVKESHAIYYLAELNFTHEETYFFTIDIFDTGDKKTLKFQHKFYVD